MMRSRELAAIDQAFAQAGERAKDAERSQRVLSALRSMSELNQSWRALVRPEQVRDAAQELKRPEFIDWMTGIFSMVERRARLAERIGISQAIAGGEADEC